MSDDDNNKTVFLPSPLAGRKGGPSAGAGQPGGPAVPQQPVWSSSAPAAPRPAAPDRSKEVYAPSGVATPKQGGSRVAVIAAMAIVLVLVLAFVAFRLFGNR